MAGNNYKEKVNVFAPTSLTTYIVVLAEIVKLDPSLEGTNRYQNYNGYKKYTR